ncbi:MAG: 2-amino-4-hydroxy-6-hydroxymethyldihydropteridine diphosphokinase [Fibrobacterota bacterium]
MISECVVFAGSNIKPEENYEKVMDFFSKTGDFEKSTKPLYTKPVEKKGGRDYLNWALLFFTEKSFEEFREYLKSVEKEFGRIKTEDKFAPRTIDLDIIVWNKKICSDDFRHRDFVKKAVYEIIPRGSIDAAG